MATHTDTVKDYRFRSATNRLGLWLFIISDAFVFGGLLVSVRRGTVTVANPWNSRSPEWQIPSPVTGVNYPIPIEVVGEPYDYGLPGSIYTQPMKAPGIPEVTPPIVPAPVPAPAD